MQRNVAVSVLSSRICTSIQQDPYRICGSNAGRYVERGVALLLERTNFRTSGNKGGQHVGMPGFRSKMQASP